MESNLIKKTEKRYWLLKSEASCYSIDDFAMDKKTRWTGIRNYQARNFMRDLMSVGDEFFFYHSSSDPTAIVGIGKISATAKPDLTAQDKKDEARKLVDEIRTKDPKQIAPWVYLIDAAAQTGDAARLVATIADAERAIGPRADWSMARIRHQQNAVDADLPERLHGQVDRRSGRLGRREVDDPRLRQQICTHCVDNEHHCGGKQDDERGQPSSE